MLKFVLNDVCRPCFRHLRTALVAVGLLWGVPLFAQDKVDEQVLSKAISARMDLVPEFKFIREQAVKLGIKVYLFGGTASAYAHYVRWDLLREAGDQRFQADRFDYDFTNIYRANQDLDVVVDGPKSAVNALQRALMATFPHFQGKKDGWEVRSLRESISDHQMALLNDFNFLNQKSDSNSTGLIEITQSQDPVVRDVFDWNSRSPRYLHDIAAGKITYYDSLKHDQTERARNGLNPTIFSALRYLIKTVQFDLQMKPEDQKIVEKLIRDFDPGTVNGYVKEKLNELGRKFIMNAVNLEYAIDLANQLGLKSKLLPLSDPQKMFTTAWWLSKEPLRSQLVGQGTGKTARELGLDVVAHDTRGFEAFDSITRSHTGAPNVFVSRPGHAGENAAAGKGFYVLKGDRGLWGTGITIRFHINPDAREGTDFTIEGDMLVFLNKNALRVIQNSYSVDFVGFFEMLTDPVNESYDLGNLERLRRKITHDIRSVSAEEEAKVLKIVQDHVKTRSSLPMIERTVLSPLESSWLKVRHSTKYPDIVNALLSRIEDWDHATASKEPSHLRDRLGKYVDSLIDALASPHWSDHPEVVLKLMSILHAKKMTWGYFPNIAERILSSGAWRTQSAVFDQLLNYCNSEEKLRVIQDTPWKDHADTLKRIFSSPNFSADISAPHSTLAQQYAEILQDSKWLNHKDVLIQFMKVSSGTANVALNLIQRPDWRQRHPEMLELIISSPGYVAPAYFMGRESIQRPKLLQLYADSRPQGQKIIVEYLTELFSRPEWKAQRPLLYRVLVQLLKKLPPENRVDLVEKIFQYSDWQGELQLLEPLLLDLPQKELTRLNNILFKTDYYGPSYLIKNSQVQAAIQFLNQQQPWYRKVLSHAVTAKNLKKAIELGFRFHSESPATLSAAVSPPAHTGRLRCEMLLR